MRENTLTQRRHRTVMCVDPQRALRVHKQSVHPRLLEFRRVERIKIDELHAVKPRQPVVSAYPKITVRRLGDRRHRTVWQAIVARPQINQIIRCPNWRTKRRQGGGKNQGEGRNPFQPTRASNPAKWLAEKTHAKFCVENNNKTRPWSKLPARQSGKFEIISGRLNSIYRGRHFTGQILNPYLGGGGIGLLPVT